MTPKEATGCKKLVANLDHPFLFGTKKQRRFRQGN
jgi:hypothetical protein